MHEPEAGWMVWSLMRTVAGVYALALALLWIFQRHFIYFPSRAAEAALNAAAAGRGFGPWRLADGTSAGWMSPGGGRSAWVVFHGNAGFALHRADFAGLLRAADPGADVCLFEYPGYGARPGPPSERRIADAAAAAVADLAAARGSPVFLMGESIGGAFAAGVAQRLGDRVGALLLVTPFNRMADVAAHHYPIFPVRLLLRERHDAARALDGFAGRAAVLVAERDTVVPRRFGERLFAGLSCEKRLWTIPGADHNDIPYSADAPWWREAVAFCRGAAREPRGERIP